jgi:hypothetical protein
MKIQKIRTQRTRPRIFETTLNPPKVLSTLYRVRAKLFAALEAYTEWPDLATITASDTCSFRSSLVTALPTPETSPLTSGA